MCIILYELIEDVILGKVLVKMFLLLFPVGLRWTHSQLVEVFEGDHLLLEVHLDELQTNVSSYFVEEGVLGTDGEYAFADAFNQIEDDIQS